jgi:DNA-binding MarR family transcriptional regulator
LKPIKTLEKDNKTLTHHILKLSEDIFQIIKFRVPPDWLTSGITVAQLRVLLILRTEGPSQMSSIASSLGIALPTATGIVDNLVRKELVTRGADPEDRRLVICKLSSKGQKTINRVWSL